MCGRNIVKKMSQDAFLIPVTFPEFKRTVLSPVDLTGLSLHPSVLNKIDEPESSRVWGVKNSNSNKKFYRNMGSGDDLLFYNKTMYEYAGKLKQKFKTNAISDEYWNGIQANMLYTISEFKKIDLPCEDLNEASDYKSNYQPQSITRMGNKAHWRVRSEHGSMEAFISKYE